jgi:acetate kinase
MTVAILVLNAGSSSLKFAVYPDAKDTPSPILRGQIAGIGTDPVFVARDGKGVAVAAESLLPVSRMANRDALVPALLDWVKYHGAGVNLKAVGHRVVHGGRDHAGPAMVTDTLVAKLTALIPLAPLHQPHSLAAIRCVTSATPDLPQVACFDTSFHRTQGRLAQLFALPRNLSDQGIIRYGFHGLSYDYIANTLPHHLGDKADGRVIVAHLGNGASMCALKERQSVATTMGFTALDGLMMGSRCGALDPGVVLYLMAEKGLTADAITTLLYQQSGLLGVSGISPDMAVLQASQTPQAQEAIDLFCYLAACELAALAAANGGLDAIVFTAGIGENSALVRSRICDRLQWMGVAIDAAANARNVTRIATAHSAVDVLVIPTDEEAVIAEATKALTCARAIPETVFPRLA